LVRSAVLGARRGASRHIGRRQRGNPHGSRAAEPRGAVRRHCTRQEDA
jgi:hypothetical protein